MKFRATTNMITGQSSSSPLFSQAEKNKMSLPSLLNPQAPRLLLPFHLSSSPNLQLLQNLRYPKRVSSVSPSLQSSFPIQDDDFEEHVIGDCLVFDEGAFDDPFLDSGSTASTNDDSESNSFKLNPKGPKSKRKAKNEVIVPTENLVPDKWREVQAEINISKKERRKIAQELEFNSRVEKKKKGLLPIRSLNLDEYKTYKEAKLAQLKPLVLDNPSISPLKEEEEDEEEVEMRNSSSQRVTPKNPRWAVYGKGFDDVTEFFNRHYEPGAKKSEGPRKMFTKEEKTLLNKKIPDLTVVTSKKWLPLHSLAASGEFYLVDALLKHNVDINAVNLDGLTALSKATLCKKHAITNYLLRESASPFVQGEDGATLMHYAVQASNIPAIKLLLLYNVDINLQDNDGWTALHVAVQARRTDVIKLLLIKGADRTLKNKDGLTPVDLCLYSGRNSGTYELIKLLKQFPKNLIKSNIS